MSTTRPPAYDERHAAPVEASRRGAHRARPNPLTSVLPVIAGMAVVVLVVVGAFTLLGGNGDPDGQGNQAGAQPSASAPAASNSASAPAPSNSASAPAPSASASEDAPAGGDVDKSIELRVLNSTDTSGIAAKFAEQLEGDDWTVGDTGDANQRNLPETRVYYAKSAQKATADAIVAALGFGEARKSAGNAGPGGVTVVLGEDAADAA